MAYTTIDDPSAYFQTALYTGNAGALSIVNNGNSDLQPDWVWLKDRGASNSHRLVDSSRGVQKAIRSNANSAEGTDTGLVTAFNSDGFSHNSSDTAWNGSGDSYVAWQWKANGGTTTTNDASSTGVGTIDSVYQANTTAGFSIVTYTGAGGNQTIAHGLGAVPNMILIKRRDDAGDWTSYHSVLGNEKYMRLNSTNAVGDQATYFNDTTPTSTVFTVGSAGDVNTSSGTHVAYCFTEIQGYSKFGSYTGNGNADGPMVFCGFKPAFVIFKNTTGEHWAMFDRLRTSSGNPINKKLHPSGNFAESTADAVDFLSNGFKIRSTEGEFNQNSTSIIFMAFAESPFVSSEGVPTTAR